jgi:hypothetical protein
MRAAAVARSLIVTDGIARQVEHMLDMNVCFDVDKL